MRPGSDAALALAVMHVIVTEKLYDAAFVGSHTTGFEELAAHVLPFTPRWGAEETCRGKPDHLVRPGLSLHATGHDPARRQLHAQGCQRLARGACDQLSAGADWRFRASGRGTPISC